MKRITSEQVVEAYSKTGLKPVISAWYKEEYDRTRITVEKCGCALTAVCAAQVGMEEIENVDTEGGYEELLVDNLDLDPSYINGFINGFDAPLNKLFTRNRYYYSEEQNAKLAAGWEDGYAAHVAVFGEPKKPVN